MQDGKIVNKFQDLLFRAAKLLAEWLNVTLPQIGDNWWEECVIDNLSYNQNTIATKKGFSKLTDFDLAALLRIAEKSWFTIRDIVYFPYDQRECIKEMTLVRNNWCHCGIVLPEKYKILDDLAIIKKFLSYMNDSEGILQINDFQKELNNSSLDEVKVGEQKSISPEPINAEPVNTQPINQEPIDSFDDSEINEKDKVEIVGTKDVGMVFSIQNLGETKKYQVFVAGDIRDYFEGQIKLIRKKPTIKWVDASTLRCYLSAHEINNPSSCNLYSLNSARIDFVPYQFRPALKMIKADEPRILIADSVGVGKTIEAGLIIKELEARKGLNNVMIICPKPLVSDRKWEEEMKRFDESFLPVDGPTLDRIISDTNRDGEWPSLHYSKIIVPYSILDGDLYEGKENKRGKVSIGLKDLEPAPHFDLIIIDEAHHIRNGSSLKEKAYEYKCVKYFCEHADAVVMLTATPIQTSDNDLYTLLNLLRPDVVLDRSSFDTMSRPNPYISKCSHIVRKASKGWQEEALEQLDDVLSTQWGENVIGQNPLYAKIKNVLKQPFVTREERVKLISDIESLHSFNLMINRTRRKDIQDFCVRRTTTLSTDFTEAQKKLHDAILDFEVATLTQLHNGRGIKFMTSTIRRQAASCVFGLVPHIKSILDKRLLDLLDDPDTELDPSELDKYDFSVFKGLASNIMKMAASLPEEDPKFDSVLKVIKEKQNSENNKIILFSSFRFTLNYIQEKLLKAGLRVEQINGDVVNEDRLDLRRRFELPKADKDAIDVMLFTEVGSEGLDYQFCDMMINYDLPWNPMRIEQRIGRIDRRGQKSEVVNIFNAITSDTVDADIYERCLQRIGVFQSSIGECEEILGEIGNQIGKIALNNSLSDKERREKLDQMADNEIRKVQEINKLESEEKELFGFDLSKYTVSREIRDAESPYVNARSLKHLVDMYLNKRLGDGNYILGDSHLKKLRLSIEARRKLLEDFRNLVGPRSELKRKWENYLKGMEQICDITFDAEIAEKNRNAFFFTPVHPLIKQAANYFSNNELSHIHLEYYDDEIPAGDYPFALYTWTYTGEKPSFKLVSVCKNENLSEEIAERIITGNSMNVGAKIDESAWKELEMLHMKMWQEAKEKHVEDSKQTASYKLESLKNNFYNRKKIIEKYLANLEDSKIVNMYVGELRNAEQRYNSKVEEIDNQINSADIHTQLIAKGVITVK